MTCVAGPSSLFPIANTSLPINETIPSAYAWNYYLLDSPFETSPLFDDSATLEATRHSLQTCREWDNICQDSSRIFRNQTNLAVCSMYPNLTTDYNDLGRIAALQAVKSTIPTCLISYCALQPSCSSNPQNCTIGSLFNADGDLSRQGVGRCWHHICLALNPSVNTDIAGIGLTISYLMQTSIALLALTILGIGHLRDIRKSRKQRALSDAQESESGTHPVQGFPNAQAGYDTEERKSFWLRSLSDFHKAQCFYSIALQIASFVIIYGKNKNRTDDMFLLLISADGLIPVITVFYTLLLLRRAKVYDVILAGISVLLASITGFSIVLGYPWTENVSDVDGPASCGGLSPQWICVLTMEMEWNYHPDFFFAGGAAALDVLMVSLTIWYFLPTPVSRLDSKYLRYPRMVNKKVRTIVVLALHIVSILSILSCTAIELFFFHIILQKDNQSITHEWSFGQVVGITIWSAVIIDLIRYEALFMWHKRHWTTKKIRIGSTVSNSSPRSESVQFLNVQTERRR